VSYDDYVDLKSMITGVFFLIGYVFGAANVLLIQHISKTDRSEG
jgi:hypothetical protein